jgi:phage baseplate assembly protein W
MIKIVNYRDLDLSFNRHPLNNDVTQFIDGESVKRALRNLLSFKRYEKPFHPEINSGIYDSLFENVSALHLDAMKTTIKLMVQKYEPRIKLYDVIILPNLDGNSYSLTLIYTVVNTQTPVNFTFTITRSR